MIPSNFGVTFKDRHGTPVQVNYDLEVNPLRWRSNASGGPDEAVIQVLGRRSGIKDLLNFLRYEVIINTALGTPCWWGYIHEIEITMDGISILVSMDNLKNRVSVTYMTRETTIEESRNTAWTENVVSTAEYGIKEHYESLGSCTTAMAQRLQAALLAEASYPKLKRSLAEDSVVQATIRCRGWIHTLSWLYYQRTDGRVEHMEGSSETQPIGWGISASTQIGFGNNTIQDALGRLDGLVESMKVVVTGSSHNNLTFTIDSSTNEIVKTYTASTVLFEPNDDLKDSAGGLGFVKADHWLKVEGSPLNSRWHWISGTSPTHVRTSGSVSGLLLAEDAGPAITLTQAQRIPTDLKGDFEDPGSSVTLFLQGSTTAQRVYIPWPMTIDKVFIEACKVGSPSDNLRVSIYTDSSTAPGTLIVSGTIAGLDLPTERTGIWVSITSNTFSPGYYWIVVERTGTVSGVDYYVVGMTTTSHNSCKMWSGSTWITHIPGWFLKFRLWGVEDLGTIIETMLAYRIQFLTFMPGLTTGVLGYTTMDQIMTVYDELERLIQVGMSTGSRILAKVSMDKTLFLEAQSTISTGLDVLQLSTKSGQELRDPVGSTWSGGVSPAGRFVHLIDLDPDLIQIGGLSPALIEGAEYDAESGKWTLSFGGERTLSDILRIQQG